MEPIESSEPQAPARPLPSASSGQVANAPQVVAALRPAFTACFNAGLARDRRMTGRLVSSLRVGATGAVPMATARRMGYLDDGVTTCVLDAARNAKFERPSGGRAVINVPVTFVPKAPSG